MRQNLSSKYFSSKQEKMIAKSLGWSVVSGSGSRNLHPGDVQSDEWLGECKTHEKPGHKIIFYKSVWDKIVDEAISKYRFPALFVDDGSQSIVNTWVMFNTLPSTKYTLCSYIYPVKKNASFKSLDMLEHRNTFNLGEPVIYTMKYYRRTVYISTLQDFIIMFGSK